VNLSRSDQGESAACNRIPLFVRRDRSQIAVSGYANGQLRSDARIPTRRPFPSCHHGRKWTFLILRQRSFSKNADLPAYRISCPKQLLQRSSPQVQEAFHTWILDTGRQRKNPETTKTELIKQFPHKPPCLTTKDVQTHIQCIPRRSSPGLFYP